MEPIRTTRDARVRSALAVVNTLCEFPIAAQVGASSEKIASAWIDSAKARRKGGQGVWT